MICFVCRREVFGQYITIDNRKLHPQCFACARCNKQINGQYNQQGGKFYHPDCYQVAYGLKCDSCRQQISGQYITIDNKKLHPQCFACARCNKQINGQYNRQGGKFYHPDCYQAVYGLKCAVCKASITGTYIKDDWGNVAHLAHSRQKTQQCDSCKRIISHYTSKGGRIINQKRSICGMCLPFVVNTPQKVNASLKKVKNQLQRVGFIIPQSPLGIKPLMEEELKSISTSSEVSEKAEGLARTKSTIGFSHKKYEHTIYILKYKANLKV